MGEPDPGPGRLEAGERRQRQQGAQAAARQEQVRRALAGGERIVQHAQEDAAARRLGGRVERGDAERLDQLASHRLRQARRQLGDGGGRRAGEAVAGPAGGGAQQREAVAPRPAAPAERGPDEGRHGPARRQPQAQAAGVDEAKRQAEEGVALGHADRGHQAQRLAVGADADVLAVVEAVVAAGVQVAGAAAGGRRHLEQRDLGAERGALERGGEPRPAGADHGEARRHPG